MAKKYISKYTGPEIDSGLDNIPKLEGKLTELESNTNQKLSELGSEVGRTESIGFEAKKQWIRFDLVQGTTYRFKNISNGILYLYTAMSNGGGEYEVIKEGLVANATLIYTHNAENRKYIEINTGANGVLEISWGHQKEYQELLEKYKAVEETSPKWSDVFLGEGEKLWIRPSNGEIVSSPAVRTFFLDAKGVSQVRAFLQSDNSVINAVSFFTSDSPSQESYMSNSVAWKGNYLNGEWYDVAVPSDANVLAITSAITDGFTPKIQVLSLEHNIVQDRRISHCEKGLVDISKRLDSEIENISYSNIDLPRGLKGWIRHGTGEYFDSTATSTFIIKVENISYIRAFLKSDVVVIDGISFYSTDEINKEGYLQSSVAWKGNYLNGEWYDVAVPSDAKIACVTSAITDGFIPIIQLKQTELCYIHDIEISSIQNYSKSLWAISQIHGMGDIYHFGMTAVAYRDAINTIPSQSIYDVRFAAKAGYKCIEANLHKTSDGKYVVTHGLNGALGHDFSDRDGNDAYGVKIGSNTLDYFRSNFVYYTDNKEYEIPITTLEEFCAEAKKNNLVVMLQYVDAESIKIAEGILGKENLFMYNAPRKLYDGVILEYQYHDDIESIIARSEEVGIPYIYSMDNPSKFDDETLRNICMKLHDRGVYVASAYCSSEKMKHLKSLGFDLFAVDGVAKVLDDNQVVVNKEYVLTFKSNGEVTWGNL